MSDPEKTKTNKMDLDATIKRLKKLQKECNAIIEALERESIDIKYNLGNLRCDLAEEFIDSQGTTGLRVFLCGAGPYAIGFRDKIKKELEISGYHDIQVIMENKGDS